MPQKFWRRHAYRDLLGIGDSEFYERLKDGRISPPDAYLGPRMPIWTDETVAADQARILAAPRPVETRPLRRSSSNTTAE
jgi:predicted DNA-binding transcriptional regulator AlpA